MKAFLAIAALTVRHAVRSHIFQLLLGVLLLCVVLIPGTAGDSTAAGFIQVSLLYSLSTVQKRNLYEARRRTVPGSSGNQHHAQQQYPQQQLENM